MTQILYMYDGPFLFTTRKLPNFLHNSLFLLFVPDPRITIYLLGECGGYGRR